MNRSSYMQGGVGGFTIETHKREDGSYEARLPDRALTATGPTEPTAIQRLRKLLDDAIMRGDNL